MRILVAGAGNIFLSDDAFGVEVVRLLASEELPEGVRVADFGIRSVHLAYELLDGGYDLTILVDALPCGGPAGTLYVMEPDPWAEGAALVPDGHSMSPDAVLGYVRMLGGSPGRVLVVGCEPASVEEGIGVSEEVRQTVGQAVRLIQELIKREKGDHDVPGDSSSDRATAARK